MEKVERHPLCIFLQFYYDQAHFLFRGEVYPLAEKSTFPLAADFLYVELMDFKLWDLGGHPCCLTLFWGSQNAIIAKS